LKAAAVALEDGNFDACLGGNVYKLRVRVRAGENRAATVSLCFLSAVKKHFLCTGLPKSHRANITSKELKAFQIAAKAYLAMTDEQIALRLKHCQIIEF
jgi:hypothetical protein